MTISRLDPAGRLGAANAFADTRYIRVRAQADALSMVRRDDKLAVYGPDTSEFIEICFRQERVVFLGLVDLGNLVVALQEACKIMPDIDAVLEIGADVDVVLAGLRQR